MIARWLARFRRPPVPIVLYTRPDCGLCVEMKQELARARLGRRVVLQEIDVDGDPRLRERYGRSIPVLEIGGRVAFKGHATAAQIETKFSRLAAEWERARVLGDALASARVRRGRGEAE